MKAFTWWTLLFAMMQTAHALYQPDSGKSDKWYSKEYEFNYCEAVLVIVFVVIAVIFEVVWHRLVHLAATKGSYSYGDFHDSEIAGEATPLERDSHGNVKHKKLLKEQIARMGSEFMTLGLLALLIFVVNQTGGFSSLAKQTQGTHEDGFAFPATGEDWLHLAEVVHIQLFLAVCLYFILILCLVKGSIRKIKKWEKLQLRHKAHSKLQLRHNLHWDGELKKHVAEREYLIRHMLKWKTERPEVFSQALTDLEINSDASDSEQQFERAVNEHFSLSVYLALNLENGVMDSIQIHFSTWLGIIVLMGLFALLHRYAKTDLIAVLPWFLVASCLLFAAMVVILHRQRRQLTKFTKDRMRLDTPGATNSESGRSTGSEGAKAWLQQMCTIHQKISSEQMLLRTLQICLFLLSYAFARVLVDYHDWLNEFTTTLLIFSAFTILFLLLAYFLPRTVPDFLAVTALPPFVDPVNLEFFFKQLLDDHMDTQAILKPSDRASQMSHYDVVSELAEVMGVRSQLDQRLSTQHL